MYKRLTAVLLLLLVLTLGACTPTENPVDALDEAYRNLAIADELSTETLPSQDGDVFISWSANVTSVLSGNQIIQGQTDQAITLTALLTLEDRSLTKLFYVTILADPTEPSAQAIVAATLDQLELDSSLAATTLITSIGDVQINWTSSTPSLLEGNTLLKPLVDTELILTATLSYQDVTDTKSFVVTILGDATPVLVALEDAETTLRGMIEPTEPITLDLSLPLLIEDVSASYLSDNTMYLSDTGTVNRPSEGDGNVTVTLTITLSLQGLERTFELTYTIQAETSTLYTGYYVGADGLEGDALRNFLHELINDHHVFSYSELWELLAYTDEDPNNPDNVILLYSQISMDEDNHGGDSNEWNREHVWPRSHGDLDDNGNPGNTDLHHIRPTKVTVNSLRGNLDFDEGGTLVTGTTDAYRDGDSFEPPDDVKGDIARMLFYMAIRYEGDAVNEVDLELNDLVNNSGPYIGKISILIQWHLEDPPDEFEQTRNDRIYEEQGNRNPFIDHPEFVEYIWDLD